MAKPGAISLAGVLDFTLAGDSRATSQTARGDVLATLKSAAAVALLVLAILSLAKAQVPACTPGKLSDYEMLGAQGCLVGENRFSGFRYYQASGGLPSSAISVTPGTSPDNDDPGMLFEAKWAAPTPQSSVSYMVDVQPKGKPISGATLQMQFGEISGPGEAKVVAEICPLTVAADNCGAQELKLQVVLSTGPARKVSDTGTLNSSTRQLRVIHLLSVAAGKEGAASFNGFMAVFHGKAVQPGTGRP
jgi:hypothetical protein